MMLFEDFSAQGIAEETGTECKGILRALLCISEAMVQDIPDVFSGTVEIEETYIGGQWKNTRKK